MILFAFAGVSAWLAFADYVLFPLLFLFVGITAYALLLRHRHKKAAC